MRQGTSGFDLTPLYPKLPAELAGLVEIAYDTGNQPSVRCIEPLIYESSYYSEDRQSVQLSLDGGTERPFIFSEVEFPGGKVVATPFLGEHADLDIRAKSTYCVRLRDRTIFVGADSSGIDPVLYRYMRDRVGTVDIAFLGMECAGASLTWLY